MFRLLAFCVSVVLWGVLPPRYDGAGNLEYDGRYFYQYDAWNRLCQVNATHVEAGSPPEGGNSVGNPIDPNPPPGEPTLFVDQLVKQFVYDGLGRLVETRSPLFAGGSAAGSTPNGSNIALRAERFYYDGIRRLEEVVEDRGVPDGLGQRERSNQHLEREYVWGPGDGPAGVDELFAQYAGAERDVGYWTIQDAGGDVVALCDGGGPLVASNEPGAQATGGSGGGSATVMVHTGRVVGQWTYGPYGEVLVAEDLVPTASWPALHLGHKGLFVDRLDEGVTTSGTDPPGASADTRLTPFAQVISYARNRHYMPTLGRWVQRDPNASGQQFIIDTAVGGMPVGNASLASFDHSRRFQEGLNAYRYLAASPLQRTDALGLLPTPVDVLNAGVHIGLGALRGGLEELTGQYAANMEADLDWALDWGASDTSYSRYNDNSWVEDAWHQGVRAGAREAALEEAWNLIDPYGLHEQFDLEDSLIGATDDALNHPAMAGGKAPGSGLVRGVGRLVNVTRKAYNTLRREFKALRMQHWEREMALDARRARPRYTPAQRERVMQGLAPLGKDGKSMVIHHRTPLFRGGDNSWGNLEFMEASEHLSKFKELHYP